MDSTVISDGLVPYRFGLLQLMLDTFHIHLPKLRQSRSDYAFHGYGELCNFVYCLLMKTRQLSSLPAIHDWDAYMDVEKAASFPVAPINEFLAHCDYGKSLLSSKAGEMPKFRGRCREFIDRLVTLLVESASTRSIVSKGLCSFCPELMLEGDDKCAFDLFSELCDGLVRCGALSREECNAAVDEYSAYVIEKRRHHSRLERSASSITDIRRYLLDDFGFQSRRHVLRVFKLCCLLVGEPNRVSPPFTLDLSSCKQAEGSVLLCCRVVQSNVLSDGYSPQSLFTESSMGLIRDAVSDAGLFYIGSDFNVWKDLCDAGVDSFIASFCELYKEFLAKRRQSSDEHYTECNRVNRLSRAEQGSRGSSVVQSSSSSVSGKGKSGGSKVGEKSTDGKQVGKTKKSNVQAGGSKTTPKKKSKKDIDPSVHHHVK